MARHSRPPEQVIVQATERYFESQGFPDFVSEAPAGGRRIDLLCMDARRHEYHAIEAKVDAPTHAFIQASRYRFFADYCYVALLAGRTNRTATRLAEESGIGLILVVWRPEQCSFGANLAVTPRRSESFFPELGDYIWRSTL
jgi:RecB family endonuclease NucS